MALRQLGWNTTALVFDLRKYGAVGVGGTDDNTAIQAAVTAAKAAGGGVIDLSPSVFGVTDYRFSSQIDISGTSTPIVFRGHGTMGDGTPAVSLTYTGTGTTAAIKAGSSRGVTFEGVALRYTSSSFTGRLVDAQKKNPGSDTCFLTFTDCTVGGATGVTSAVMLVCIDGSHDVQFTRTRFSNADLGVVGKLSQTISAAGGYAVRVGFHECSFAGMVTSALKGADDSWTINAVFEPLTSGAAGAYVYDAGVYGRGVTFRDCWFGDDSGTVAGTWITWAGDGLSVDGGAMSVQQATTGIKVDGNDMRGIKARTVFFGQGGVSKGVDFGTTAGHSGVEIVSVFNGVAQPVAGTVPSGAIIGTGGGAYLSDPEFTGTVKVGRPGANLLTANQASPSTTTGFSSNSNASLSATGGVLTTTAVATASESSFYLASVAITAGKQYTFQVEVDPGAVSGRRLKLDISWLDGANAAVTARTLATTGGQALTAGGGYQANSVTGQAPTGATQARVIARILDVTASETYNWRKLGFARGTLQAWAVPSTPAGEVILDATNGLDLPEVTAPSAPTADRARLYAKDNGSGKTSLAVRFNSDSEIVLATAGTAPVDTANFVTPRWSSTYYYNSNDSVRSTLALTQDRLYLMPLDAPSGATIDRIAAEITTAATAGGVVRLGVYASGTGGLPGTLIQDCGTLDSTTTGVKEITLSPVVTLTGGRVWLALAPQVATCTMRTHGSAPDRRVGSSTLASTIAANGNNCFTVNSITGALPSTVTTPGSNTQAPVVAVRAA